MDLHALNSLLDLFHGRSDRPRYDGTDIIRMGNLARQLGIQRWKRSPSGTGRNVDLLRLGLRSHHLAIYAPSANAEVGDSGTTASATAITLIHADDIVVLIDTDDGKGSRLATDAGGLWTRPIPGALVSKYRGDRVRAAVEHDAIGIAKAVILPAIQVDRSSDEAA